MLIVVIALVCIKVFKKDAMQVAAEVFREGNYIILSYEYIGENAYRIIRTLKVGAGGVLWERLSTSEEKWVVVGYFSLEKEILFFSETPEPDSWCWRVKGWGIGKFAVLSGEPHDIEVGRLAITASH